MPKIYCGVTTCQYNKQEMCNVNQIEVDTNAEHPEVTEAVNCMTFKPQG